MSKVNEVVMPLKFFFLIIQFLLFIALMASIVSIFKWFWSLIHLFTWYVERICLCWFACKSKTDWCYIQKGWNRNEYNVHYWNVPFICRNSNIEFRIFSNGRTNKCISNPLPLCWVHTSDINDIGPIQLHLNETNLVILCLYTTIPGILINRRLPSQIKSNQFP